MDKILIAEDDPVQRKIITLLVEKKLGFSAVSVANGQAALEALQSHPVDTFAAALLDINMPVMDGFEALSHIQKYHPGLPVIMLTAQDSTAAAVKSIKHGAYDFIVKPPEPAHLEVVLKNAVRMRGMALELARLKRDKEGGLNFGDLVGYNEGLAQPVLYGRKAAASDVPVLIYGETGVGKELFARAIHGESKRTGAPFVAINCGAIPENLVESILFGHEKGAFTGATHRTLGKFREAEGGTIFLDEIGELSPDAQVKMLRVLQQKEVEPVGAGKTAKINVRIISATNLDLKAEVKAGRFREDLYFRLNVLPIHVPALRDRAHDAVKLAEHFVQRFAALDMVHPKLLTDEAKDYLRQCPWPGNVRELENLIRRALVLSDEEVIGKEQLAAIHDHTPLLPQALPASGLSVALQRLDGRFKTMDEIESEALQVTLEFCEHNITRASELLGMAKSTFYRKIKDTK